MSAEVANAVYALNELLFLCTRDSGHTRIFIGKWLGQEVGPKAAQRYKQVFVNPANIEVEVDFSDPRANRFLRKLFLWQVRNFPNSMIFPVSRHGLPTALYVRGINHPEMIPVSPKIALQQIEMANGFLNALTAFVKDHNRQK